MGVLVHLSFIDILVPRLVLPLLGVAYVLASSSPGDLGVVNQDSSWLTPTDGHVQSSQLHVTGHTLRY
jgi:hypothetical protein